MKVTGFLLGEYTTCHGPRSETPLCQTASALSKSLADLYHNLDNGLAPINLLKPDISPLDHRCRDAVQRTMSAFYVNKRRAENKPVSSFILSATRFPHSFSERKRHYRCAVTTAMLLIRSRYHTRGIGHPCIHTIVCSLTTIPSAFSHPATVHGWIDPSGEAALASRSTYKLGTRLTVCCGFVSLIWPSLDGSFASASFPPPITRS